MNYELVIGDDLFAPLRAHLFQEDRDEHAAVVLAGEHESARGTRFLARELHLVPPEHFPPGDHGYRQTAPRFVAELAMRASAERLVYVALHSHPGALRQVALSRDDLAAHRRLFPHLLNLTGGRPVVGIAMGGESADGEVWSRGADPQRLRSVRVIGHKIAQLTSESQTRNAPDPRFDRQARLFGAAGQEILRALHVSVVGAGGGGSMLVQQLAHLGVGQITVIDYDVVKDINLSRIVGSTTADIGTKKVDVLRRLVKQIDATIRVNAIDGDIADLPTAVNLLDSDFIFLATDNITSRLVFNAIVHRYLIPGAQIGAKVDVNEKGRISQVYVAVRPVLPSRGCLYCNSLIDPIRLQHEARTDEEREAQNYLNEPEIIDPSVVSLNGLAAAHAVNVMLLAMTGLAESTLLDHRLFLVCSGDVFAVKDVKQPDCPFCSREPLSVYGRGDPASELPCRHQIVVSPGGDQPMAHARFDALSRLLRSIRERWA